MNPLVRAAILVALVALCGVHVRGQTRLIRQVVGSGAAAASSPQYLLAGTVGQTIIGRTTSSSNVGALGFWYTYPYAYTTGVPTDYVTAVTGRAPSIAVSPNPTRGPASVAISLPVAALVSLAVYDQTGARRLTLIERRLEAGTTTVVIPGQALPSGEYIVLLATPARASVGLTVVR